MSLPDIHGLLLWVHLLTASEVTWLFSWLTADSCGKLPPLSNKPLLLLPSLSLHWHVPVPFFLPGFVCCSLFRFLYLSLSFLLPPPCPPPLSGLTLWLITAAAPVLLVPALSWFQLLWGVRACGLSHWLQLPLSSRCCHCTTAHWQGELHSSITNLPLLTALPVLYQLHNFKPHLSVGCTLHLLRQTDNKPIKKAFFFFCIIFFSFYFVPHLQLCRLFCFTFHYLIIFVLCWFISPHSFF